MPVSGTERAYVEALKCDTVVYWGNIISRTKLECRFFLTGEGYWYNRAGQGLD